MKRKQRKSKKAGERKKSTAKSKLLLLAIVGVLAGAFLFTFNFGGAGSNPAPDVIPGGNLTVTDDFYDFGRISMKDGKVSRSFRLQNTGSEPALIRKLYTS